MSEEIVYANLKIQDPDKKEETQKSDKCGGKGKILSHGWDGSDHRFMQCEFLIFISLNFNMPYEFLFSLSFKPQITKWLKIIFFFKA